MIRLHAKAGILGEGPVETVRIPWQAGMRPRQLLEQAPRLCPGVLPAQGLAIAVNGRRVADDDLDAPLPDEADVIVAADVAGVELLTFALVSALVSTAISYVASLLMPGPKPPGVPQERGDESSPTYAWDQITTSFGQGGLVPFVYGRHAVGGQVIYTDVFASAQSGTQRELLRLVLALSEGWCFRIGDTIIREWNGLGGFAGDPPGSAIPSGIAINGNLLDHTNLLPGARVWTRPGNLNQTPLPSNPFRGATATIAIGEALNDDNAEAIYTWPGTDPVASLAITMAFPGGIYAQDNQGNLVAAPVQFSVSWRPQGTTSWRPLYRPTTTLPLGTVTFGAAPRQGATVESFGADLQIGAAPVEQVFEVRVRRLPRATLPAGTQAVDGATWRSVGFNIAQTFAYPRVALLGLELLATGRLQGALPQVRVQLDGIMVNVWDQSLGWSPLCWDVPPAPFNWMTYPPGRNPAWIALHWLLSPWGLGKWISSADIDLAAFRRWSIFCDQDPNPGNPWGEAAFTCDLVGDSPRPAWEVLLAICATGRAKPLMVGRKISVVYQFRDAHSDALVSVPAKAPVQLFTSSNCTDLTVEWLPKNARPTAFQFQFLNEAKSWAQDVLIVEDDEGSLNSPNSLGADQWRPEVVQVYGQTREGQLRRQGVLMHRLNRLVRRKVTFRTGPWALAATVGDLIEVEHEVLRPFAAAVPMSCVVRTGGTATTTIVVDHVVTGSGLQVVVRDPDGEPQRAAVSSLTPVAGGTQLNLAAAVTCAAGAPAVVGQVDQLTEVYEIASIALTEDVERQVVALQWVPEVYDPLDPGAGGTESASQAQRPGSPPAATDLRVVPQRDGTQLVTWQRPPGREAASCRVWVQDPAVGVWLFIDETRRGELRVGSLSPWRTYLVAVSVADQFGVHAAPEDSAQLEVVAEEFPPVAPPPARRLQATPTPDGLLFAWPEMGFQDLAYYELRAGADWGAATVLWRGLVAEVALRWPRAAGTYQVAPRARSGLYGRPARLQVASVWTPPGLTQVGTRDELSGAPTGTLTGLTYSGGTLVLSSGVHQGTYETLELELTTVTSCYWQVRWDSEERDATTADEWTFLPGSGEAAWRTANTRPPSPGLPGIDPLEIADDLVVTAEDLPDTMLAGVDAGEVGQHTWCRVESRYHDGSSWGAWAPHQDGVVTACRIQVRVILGRRSATYARTITELQIFAYSYSPGHFHFDAEAVLNGRTGRMLVWSRNP